MLRIKIPATDWEKVFVNYISDEGLATRKYKVPQIQGQQLKRKKKKAQEFEYSPKNLYEWQKMK